MLVIALNFLETLFPSGPIKQEANPVEGQSLLQKDKKMKKRKTKEN